MTLKIKAFTLMELIVAIAIIGMMAVLISPSFLAYRRNAQLNLAAQSLETSIEGAFSLARSSNETFCVTNMASGAGETDGFAVLKGAGCDGGIYEETAFSNGIELVEPERFNLVYKPPYGDLEFQQNSTEDELSLKLINTIGVSKTIKIYKNSGLVTVGNFESVEE